MLLVFVILLAVIVTLIDQKNWNINKNRKECAMSCENNFNSESHHEKIMKRFFDHQPKPGVITPSKGEFKEDDNKCAKCSRRKWYIKGYEDGKRSIQNNFISKDAVIKLIDEHTTNDGKLDDDISIILEEIDINRYK